MENRELLISLAIKYNGEYSLIKKAIENNEICELRECRNCITILDKEYPKRLLDLKRPPYVLFYKGDINLLNEESIGIVGSRKPCDYALRATREVVLNRRDKVVISGMAKGIDACAHKYADRTIGILGCGINYIYPYCNKDLFKEVEKKGLLISEYPDKSLPYAYHFPFRNRLIAALSDEVYIMEVHEKSGTITTVNESLELGKDIRVLPYDVFNESGSYNNYLINEGALMINIKIDK
ncbi:MAG: DNA-processing protein DprA [Erysipelotrichaceae bacterium]|nr:DNA-processing protein DprA [Erysipelotrichaceae bacterium]